MISVATLRNIHLHTIPVIIIDIPENMARSKRALSGLDGKCKRRTYVVAKQAEQCKSVKVGYARQWFYLEKVLKAYLLHGLIYVLV